MGRNRSMFVSARKTAPHRRIPSYYDFAHPRGAILELGAGVGRITHPLLELSYRVTAVDNSPEMLV